MKVFVLDRLIDIHGVSGTGIVAQGVVFDDGTVAMRWLTDHRSTSFYESIEDLQAIHGHNGGTWIRYVQVRRAKREIVKRPARYGKKQRVEILPELGEPNGRADDLV